MPPPPVAAPSKKSSSKMGCCGVIVGGIFALIIILFVIGSMQTNEEKSTRSTPAPTSFHTGNAANDILLAKPADEQALYLGYVADKRCRGRRAFYMGSAPSDHSAFWSVECSNGQSYEIEVFADSVGSTKVLNCAVVRALNMNCFEKIPGTE